MNLFYQIYLICIALPVFLIATIITSLITIAGSVFDAQYWGYHPAKLWSKLTCYLLLTPIEIKGKEFLDRKSSYVFVPNHQGAFDIFLVYGFIGRPFKWMMKQSLRKLPFVGKACESAGHIYINNASPHSLKRSMEQAEKTLQNGVSLVVFPASSRSEDGHMKRFKRGEFQLADEFQLPVVPVIIEGSYEVLPKNRAFIKRFPLTLRFLEPIPPYGKGPDNVQATMKKAREVMEEALPERYK